MFFLLIASLVALSVDAKIIPPVTFKDVKISGYSIYTKKFETTINSSNSLKENLPTDKFFDAIYITDQVVPVLHPNSISDIDSLDELVIERCQLSEIRPGVFKNVPQLRKIVIKFNKLTEIKSGVFNHLEASTIDLSANQIKAIDSDAFNDLPNILHINLRENFVKEWDSKWFLNTPNLNRISLGNNYISKIPNKAFKNLEGDRKLGKDLGLNLDFSYNQIDEIATDAFDGITKINHLWLDNNKLKRFDEKLLQNVKIMVLQLSGNEIECLNGDLNVLFKADQTFIDANPFECTCLADLQKWLKKHDKDVDLLYAKSQCDIQRIKSKMITVEKSLQDLRLQ